MTATKPITDPAESVLSKGNTLGRFRGKTKIGSAAALVVIAALLVFAYLVGKSNSKKGSLNIDVGSVSIKMNVENDSQAMKDLLDKVFADESAKSQAQALLADFYDEYCPHDAKLIPALAKLRPNDPVPRTLKEMVLRHQSPFKEELVQVPVGFLTGRRFSDSEAVVCDGSEYFMHKIYLYNGRQDNYIELNANQWRPCPSPSTSELRFPMIQITTYAAHKLLGDTPLKDMETLWVGYGPSSQ